MSSKKFFLATTPIDYFWDKQSEYGLFLGEWCKSVDNEKICSNLNWDMLDYLWSKEESIDKGIAYCNLIYEEVILILSSMLNDFHKMDKDIKYWDLILRPWLFNYIQIIYDKYMHIKFAKDKYENIYTYTINENSYCFVDTPQRFTKNIVYSDAYNLQLYSQIIKKIGIENLDYCFSFFNMCSKTLFSSSIKERFVRFVSKLSNYLFANHSILIVSPYFKHSKIVNRLILSVRSKCMFIFDNLKYDIELNYNVDILKRKKIFICDFKDFKDVLFSTFVYNFPSIYLENFSEFRKKILNTNIPKSEIIYSANALYYNEIFKIYVAENYQNLLITYGQHGGEIGIDKAHMSEETEINFVDIYFTFGWNREKTRVLPQVYKTPKKNNFMHYKGILLVMNAMPKYFYRFTYYEESSKMLLYIENTKVFCKHFKLIDNLVVRLYKEDYGWNIKDRLLESNNLLKFNNTMNYYKQIKHSRLVVFDHMHTGYLETLSMNIPTIIFIPKNIYYFRDSVKPYIELLKSVKILFEDAVEASKFIDSIYDNIEIWWNSVEVQKVREDFCYRYVRTSDTWADEWVQEFNNILEEQCKSRA